MTQREILRKKIRIASIIVILVLLSAYGIFQARNLAEGPIVSITAPLNGAVSSSSVVTISGTAKNVAFMTLDGEQIYTDEQGNWSEDRVLAQGYNVVTLYAKDTFGKETTKTLELSAE